MNLSSEKLYAVWSVMKHRCSAPTAQGWQWYGGRGIRVCEEWQHYLPFRTWALANGYHPDEGLSLDRIDCDGDYSPDNCRWADLVQQANNKRNNMLVTAFGEVKTAAMWLADPRCVVGKSCLYYRLNHDWDAEKAITEPSLRAPVVEPEVDFDALPGCTECGNDVGPHDGMCLDCREVAS